MRLIGTLILFCLIFKNSHGIELYVDPAKGNDNNNGSKAHPFATLSKAVQYVDELNGNGALTIKLMPGLYALSNKVDVHPKRAFNNTERFTIEAFIMPDDTNWRPDKMPVIASTADTSTNWGFPCSVGMMVSASHVTIRGIKFTGNPNPDHAGFYYPIGRESLSLEDLEISQCTFVGDRFSSPIQVGVLTCGHETKVDHCIFYNCRNAVVYWRVDKTQRNNSMTHCIVYGAYQSALWTAKSDSNFQFYNNVITHCTFAWIKNYYNTDHYNFHDCVITDNTHFRGEWQKPDTLVERHENEPDLTEVNVIKNGQVKLLDTNVVSMEDELPINYLNLAPGSLGYNLNAGLFKKSR